MIALLSQHELLKALQHAAKAIEPSGPLPILAGVLLELHPERLSVTASNTRVMIQVEVPLLPRDSSARDSHVHRVVVPGRYLLETVRKLPAGEVRIELDDRHQLTVRADSTVVRLSGASAEEFPLMSGFGSPDRTVRMTNRMLKAAISRVSFAVSATDTRPLLTGVLCTFDADKVRLLATDSIRLASHTLELPADRLEVAPIEVVVPGATLSDLCKMLVNDDDMTEIEIDPNRIRFRNNSFRLSSVLLEGTFPPTDKLIPRANVTELIVSAPRLVQALERVCLLAGTEALVRLEARPNEPLRISSMNSDAGDAVAEIPLQSLHGEPSTVFFNGRYMAELMRALGDADASIRLTGGMSPLVIRPAEVPTPLYLLTPIRTRETQSA